VTPTRKRGTSSFATTSCHPPMPAELSNPETSVMMWTLRNLSHRCQVYQFARSNHGSRGWRDHRYHRCCNSHGPSHSHELHTGTQRVTSSDTMDFYEVSLLQPGDYNAQGRKISHRGWKRRQSRSRGGKQQRSNRAISDLETLLWRTRHLIFARIRLEVADECPSQRYRRPR
jgi:hypothetical protein